MKNLFFLLLLGSIFSTTLHSQSSPKAELGLQFSSLDRFSVVYKKRVKDQRYWTFSAGLIALEVEAKPNTQQQLGVGGSIQYEKRKRINQRVEFIHGPGFGLFGNYQRDDNNNSWNTSIGFDYLLGARFSLVKELALSINLYPGLGMIYEKSESGNFVREEIRYRFSARSNFASIGLFYCFGD